MVYRDSGTKLLISCERDAKVYPNSYPHELISFIVFLSIARKSVEASLPSVVEKFSGEFLQTIHTPHVFGGGGLFASERPSLRVTRPFTVWAGPYTGTPE